MIEELEREIKGYTYKITTLPARANLLFAAKWAKHLKPVAPLLKSLSNTTNILDIDLSTLDFQGMLESLCDNLEPKQFSDLIFDSFKNAKVITDDFPNGLDLSNAGNFDMFFSGKLDHIMFVLFEILKINIIGKSDFFLKLTTKAVQSQQKAKAKNT